MIDFAAARAGMVQHQLRRRGISDARVLRAMAEVRRETFVSPDLAAQAYDDAPLPIDGGQTISQPYMVAFMLEAAAIAAADRVLEVGTGSGYAAAILGRLAACVHTIERDASLFDVAQARLAAAGDRIHVRHDDGHAGWPEAAPFDAILVAAAPACVPAALKQQLAVGGRLIVPIGDRAGQRLVKLTRVSGETFEERHLAPVRFVPLVPGQTT